MGDLPEPKAPMKAQRTSRFQVTILTHKKRGFFKKKKLKLNDPTKESCTLQNGRDDAGEGPTLDRPLTTLEKLHIIVGYAIVRSDLR